MARTVMTQKKIAMMMNEARQLNTLVAIPDDILPIMKPTGLPEPRAPVALFNLVPSWYVAKSVPIAGGAMAAVPRPRKPQSTFRATAFGTNAARSEERLRNAMPPRSWILRPRRSAVLPKKSMKEPLASLVNVSRDQDVKGLVINTLSQQLSMSSALPSCSNSLQCLRC